MYNFHILLVKSCNIEHCVQLYKSSCEKWHSVVSSPYVIDKSRFFHVQHTYCRLIGFCIRSNIIGENNLGWLATYNGSEHLSDFVCRLWIVKDWRQDRFARETVVRPRSSVIPQLLVTHNTGHSAELKASRAWRATRNNNQVNNVVSCCRAVAIAKCGYITRILSVRQSL